MFIMDNSDNSLDNYNILYENNDDQERKEPIMKKFVESLKITFFMFWNKEDKKEWMKLIRMFSILDTYHLKNLMELYNENIFARYNNFQNYLNHINKNFKNQNVGYFVIALQHFLQQR
jgi:hypothetical protein